MATATKRRTRTQIRGHRALPADRARSAQPLDRLLLDGRRLDMQIGDRLTGAKLTRTIEGASSVSLDVWDGDGAVLSSSALGVRIMSRAATVTIDGITYGVNGVGGRDTLSIAAESGVVRRAKAHGKKQPLRVSRGTTTCAAFCAQMFRAAGIPVLVLDEHVGQRIAGTKQLSGAIVQARGTSTATRSRTSARGVTGADLTIKRRAPDSEQRRVMAAGRDAARQAAAPKLAALTLFCALIQENAARGPNALQVTAATARELGITPSNIKQCATAFLTKGFTGGAGSTKGAIYYARQNPSWSPGQIINAMQNPGTPLHDYDQWRDEAQAWVDASGAASSSAAASGGSKDYVYERKRGESTYAAARRLLDERGWRLFDREGVMIIASDPALMRARPSVFLERGLTDFWQPDIDWHEALRINELAGQAAAGRYQLDPGEVAHVTDLPSITRDWLIGSTTVDLLNPSAPVEVALRRPQQPKAEPAAEQADTTSSSSSSSGSLRERIVKTATDSLTTKTGYRRYSQAGALTTKILPGAGERTDCSQWVRAVYLAAGAQDPGSNTYQQDARGKRTSRPQPGDLMMTNGHVEIYVGPNGRTIGHGSPPIDYANVSAWPGHWFVTFDFLN
ncbi:MAG: NlpC/P60 family protein [Patulibacter minatonensis]